MKKRKGNPQPFGVEVKENQVNFALQVPSGKKCELLLYEKGKEVPKQRFELPESEGIGEVRFLAIEDINPEKYEYNFQIDDEIYVDPYVKEVAGKEKFGVARNIQKHQVRGRLVSDAYDWGEDHRLHLPWNEVIAYSLHVRGFTKHTSSKVTHRGTFLGIMEKLPYLKQLGINQIQCMPVYEFEECGKERTNYWGYGKGFYFAPKQAYAAGKSAVKELKDLVKSCHKEGIEVVLEMPFTPEISVDKALECLRYYMLEYHMDGFVVNPYSVSWEELNADPFLKDIKLMRKEDGFQNIMRRFLKGDENMVNDVIWALRHNSAVDGKCNYITAQTGFTMWDLVSYDGKHNEANGERNLDGPDYNYSWNCGAEGASRKRSVLRLRKNQVKNAFALLMSAQGTPCLLAGDEFYNSQKGNNNAYCQDNEIGWVNWNKFREEDPLYQYVKAMIAFRKNHLCLHQKEELKGMDRTACGMPDVSYHGENAWQVKAEVASRQLGVMYALCGEEKESCFVAYNMHWLIHHYALPSPGKDRAWYLAADTENGFLEEPVYLEEQKEIVLRERSISLLVSRKTEGKKRRRKGKGQTRNEGNTTFSHDHKA